MTKKHNEYAGDKIEHYLPEYLKSFVFLETYKEFDKAFYEWLYEKDEKKRKYFKMNWMNKFEEFRAHCSIHPSIEKVMEDIELLKREFFLKNLLEKDVSKNREANELRNS